ncbi:hypothetical protein [uncultured Brachyspira sp.]|nr:hypothetical protein [uncultured Brachyspira sp.]
MKNNTIILTLFMENKVMAVLLADFIAVCTAVTLFAIYFKKLIN